jgi:hypothetical protein
MQSFFGYIIQGLKNTFGNGGPDISGMWIYSKIANILFPVFNERMFIVF